LVTKINFNAFTKPEVGDLIPLRVGKDNYVWRILVILKPWHDRYRRIDVSAELIEIECGFYDDECY
jgi:hypothetical protein